MSRGAVPCPGGRIHKCGELYAADPVARRRTGAIMPRLSRPAPSRASDPGSLTAGVAVTDELKVAPAPEGPDKVKNSESENGPLIDVAIAGMGSLNPTGIRLDGLLKLLEAISVPVPNGLFAASR